MLCNVYFLFYIYQIFRPDIQYIHLNILCIAITGNKILFLKPYALPIDQP
jgi:hypothetical protein